LRRDRLIANYGLMRKLKLVRERERERELCQLDTCKDAFANFRQLRAATIPVSSPILDSNGSLVNDRQHKLNIWEEHFSQLLNRSPAAISEKLQQAAMAVVEGPAISSAPSNVGEVAAALNKLKNGKAPGICNITPEILKAGGYSAVQWLTNLFQAIWNGGTIPEDWKKGISFCLSTSGKVAAVTARTIVVTLCCLARANCLHMYY